MAQPQAIPLAPKKEQLEAQLMQLTVTRSQLKDQVETIEKQTRTIAAMLQLLAAQDAEAKAEAEVLED